MKNFSTLTIVLAIAEVLAVAFAAVVLSRYLQITAGRGDSYFTGMMATRSQTIQIGRCDPDNEEHLPVHVRSAK